MSGGSTLFFRSVFSSLALLSRRKKLALLVLSVATLLINGLDILAIASLGAVAALALGAESSFSFLIPPTWTSRDATLVVLLSATGLFITKTVLGVLLARAKENFLARLQVSYSDAIAAYLFSGKLSKIKAYSKSDLEWAILRSTTQAFGKTLSEALTFFAEVSLFLAILMLFLIVDWQSTALVTFFFAMILLLFQLTSNATIGASGSKFAAGSVSVSQGISDMADAYREITVGGKTAYFLDRISQSRALVAKADAKIAYLSALPRLLVEVGLIAGALGFVAFQLQFRTGGLDYEVLSIFIVGSLRMMSALLPIQRGFMRVRYQAPQAEAAQTLVREASIQLTSRMETNRLRSPKSVLDQPSHGGLEIERLSYSYPGRTPTVEVLSNINLKVSAGTTAAFIGPSGAGKSTLADLILGLDSPSNGRVLWNGEDPQELRSAHQGVFGYVPQKPGLIAGTVGENVALGVKSDYVDENALWRALRVAELEDLVHSLPDGIHSDLGQQIDGLSGGQIQRIGLARALYSGPSLLILDEATSALDPETEAAVSRGLATLRGETTIITVAHRLATIQNADVVFLMDSGKIIASGTLEELIEVSPLVEKYVRLAAVKTQSEKDFQS